MINSITLLGSSSGRNAGDAALISGIMDSIDEAMGRRIVYEIPTVKPSFIRSTYKNETRPISMMPWAGSLKMLGIPTYRSIMRTDLSLVFDAVLFDRSLYNPLFNYLSSLYILLPLAKKRGKRMGFYNVTAGPVPTKAGQKMLREIAELMDFITVRDEASLKILRDIGVTNPNVSVTADAAVTVACAPEPRVLEIIRKIGLDPNKPILGININKYIDTWADPNRKSMGPEKFVEVYSAGVNSFLKDHPAQVMLVSTQHHDVPISRALQAKIVGAQGTALLSNTEYNHHEIKGALGRVSLLLGMRLHCTILGASALAPTLGLVYQPKVRHFFQSLGAESCCLSFENFTAEDIKRHLTWGWENRAQLKSHLAAEIPRLQNQAKEAARMVAALSLKQP